MRETGRLRAGTKGGLPTISDYIDALANPHGRFRTLGEIEPLTDSRGEIVFFAGNNSAVFPAMTARRPLSLKCYIKNGLHAVDIYSYLSSRRDDLLSPVRLLTDEIFVYDIFGNTGYYDVVTADWISGVTLETAIRRASRDDGFTFAALSDAFERMARELLAREWAHGDLKPENIIVRDDGTLCLIDYDAMFIPTLAGRRTLEVGTPPYQHPSRDETLFDKSIDDYATAIIAASLRALALDGDLYKKYNRSDNIILHPAEIPTGRSEAYMEMLRLFAGRGDHASYNLARSLDTPSPRIPDLARLLRGGNLYIPADRDLPMVADVRTPYEATYPEAYHNGHLWGYRDTRGREVIPAVYTVAHAFSDGVAVVCIDGRWQVVDPAGRVVLDCGEYREMKPFSEGLASVCTADGLWGYITREGTVAVEPRYEMTGLFREGVAVVRTAGRYGYIDRAGEWAIAPVYDYATGFRDGRATVQSDGEMFEIGIRGEKF